MTLVAAWIKENSRGNHLIVASDSRLGSGFKWDCAPKIFPLPRNDSVIAFSGLTDYAYPILLQLLNATNNYKKSLTRELDVTELIPHIIKIINDMRTSIYDTPKGSYVDDSNEFSMIFAGYSSIKKSFYIWRIYYNKNANSFNCCNIMRNHGDQKVVFIGDNVNDAYIRLNKIMTDNGKTYGHKKHRKTKYAELEPLDVLVDMITDPLFTSIGGPPQMVKIYPYANVLPVNFFWPKNNPQKITNFGRNLLGYESTQYATMDLTDHKLYGPNLAYMKIEGEQLTSLFERFRNILLTRKKLIAKRSNVNRDYL
ncbi:hypothetical protein [Acidithiobacillus ferriphilus]|jgi:hypothetical protein|uniref:hypothetical protein n=1 Tax=Acidithiobacillus ferriphilus TaxID=1689834 RepID=UPI002DB64291|nr:hypothetical protein [Acidithiobacillus ferriphilus]MEB8474496.1 hypothetical protein [Acidithiobacillus ferriphilus]